MRVIAREVYTRVCGEGVDNTFFGRTPEDFSPRGPICVCLTKLCPPRRRFTQMYIIRPPPGDNTEDITVVSVHTAYVRAAKCVGGIPRLLVGRFCLFLLVRCIYLLVEAVALLCEYCYNILGSDRYGAWYYIPGISGTLLVADTLS